MFPLFPGQALILVVGISESSNSRVSNQNPRSRLESLGESLDSRNFQNLVLEI